MKKEYLDFPFELKKEDVQENGFFKGYASTFNDEPDSYGDIVVPGAFSKTLEKGGRNGFGVAMLWQHNQQQPIGVWHSILEDKKGLQVEGQLAMKTQIGSEAYELMKMGAVKGLSFGYDVVDHDFSKDRKIRFLKGVDLWEISPVTFPANRSARIDSVKALLEGARTERELEAALRDAGLTKGQAFYIVKLCRPSLRDLRMDSTERMNKILQALRSINN